MTIGELAGETGISASTIRYWERIGVLSGPPRVNGQRRYSREAIYRLAVLRLARACRFHLPEMRHLMNGFRPGTAASERWQDLTRKKKNELNTQINQLKAMRRVVDRVLACKCADLSDCGRMAASVIEAAAK